MPAREAAQRVKGIVGDEPPPDQIPHGIHRLGGIAAACRLMQRTKERSAVRAQGVEDFHLAIVEVGTRTW